ncbi:MAG: hypothetical protein IJ338_00470 [Bacteroidaceae bacterium]|nr:hypothetical protein [Bacteroidaceae bacterium]
MKINKLLLLSALPALGLLSSCEEMDENYKQYKEQDIYSGKVLDLKSKIGFESAILYWENPQDQVSKGIEIVAIGNDTVTYSYDFATLTPNTSDLVIYRADSVRINNLNQGTAYSMTVYTVDAYGNRSIDVSTPVMPLSQEAYELLVPPICAGTIADDGSTAINFQGITSLAYNFAGTINYTVFDGDEKVAEGKAEGEGNAKTLVEAVSGLKPAKPYKVQFETKVLPLSGSTPIEDTVTLKSESNIYVSISAIKEVDYKMYADSVDVSFKQAKNELAKKIVVRSNGTIVKEIANTKDSEGGKFGLKLTENKKVKLEFVRVDENGEESDVVSKEVQPATEALVKSIDYPKFSIGKDVLGLMVLNADKFGDNSKFKTKGFKEGEGDDAKEFAKVTLGIVDEDGNAVFPEQVISFPAGDRTFSLSLSTLDTDATYTVSYSFECYPKANGKTSEDAFTIAREFKIEKGAIK